MNLEFFDVNVFLGKPVQRHCPPTSTPELLNKMDELNITNALIWHIAQYEHSAEVGNELVNQEIKKSERFLGCWTLLPPQTEEVINSDFFDNMKKNNIIALRAFPKKHKYILSWLVFGNIFEEMVAKRIPLILSMEKNEISWESLYKLLEEIPELTCILADIGIWSQNRYFWPLMEKFPNLYIDTSLLALENNGIEYTVKRLGADRLLFGTGYPERYAEASILELLHCPISEKDKKMIAHENLQNLIADIKL